MNAIVMEPELFKLCILTGPYVTLHEEYSKPYLIFLAKWIGRLLPNFHMFGAMEELRTRNKERETFVRNDDLMWHGGFKLRFAYMTLLANLEFNETMKNIDIPILIQHGTGDKINPLSGSEMLLDSVKSKDKNLKTYEGAYHTLYAELEEVQVELLHDQLQWLQERL